MKQEDKKQQQRKLTVGFNEYAFTRIQSCFQYFNIENLKTLIAVSFHFASIGTTL